MTATATQLCLHGLKANGCGSVPLKPYLDEPAEFASPVDRFDPTGLETVHSCVIIYFTTYHNLTGRPLTGDVGLFSSTLLLGTFPNTSLSSCPAF